MEQEHFEALYPADSRFSEIAEMVSFIKEGNSCQLIGLPGVGRSTLLELLTYNKQIRTKHLGDAQKHMHFVLANFSEIRNRSLFDVMKFLFLTLTESLRERGMLEENKVVGDKFREHLSFNDELVLFQGFKEAVDYMALDRKITIVFLFDRFEEYVPTVTSEFFSNLRSLRNRAKYQFSVVFSLNRPLETMLEPSLLSDFYEWVAGHNIYLRLYDEVSTKFRVSYIQKITGKKLQDQSYDKIIHFTGGQGKLTKLAVEKLLVHEKEPEDLAAFLLEKKSIQGGLLEIWLSLSPAEQADILQEAYTDKEIVAYLVAVGLLKDDKLQIPLLRSFIKTISSATQQTQQIIYDENTNTIRQGTVVLSDKLTSSEFRLLRYLLQKPDLIIERDEIINVVWQDMKSTAGITDQAVDQLIFRLRRKIEEDANNPRHLLTVKGRGFKFTP